MSPERFRWSFTAGVVKRVGDSGRLQTQYRHFRPQSDFRLAVSAYIGYLYRKTCLKVLATTA